jgi:hypothetical protein
MWTSDFGKTTYWEFVARQAASGDVGYSYLVPTGGDSAATSNPYTLVRVQARHASTSAFWNSAPDFVPGPETLVVATVNTGDLDVGVPPRSCALIAVDIHDPRGRRIATPFEGLLPAGPYSAR